jgi:hypothetical protein
MKYKSQTGSAHLVIIIILTVAVMGLLGFVFWQNFAQKKADTTPVSTTTSKQSPVLADMIEYPATIFIKSTADVSQLTNAPTSFKDFLVKTIDDFNADPETKKQDCHLEIGINKIYKQMYASGTWGYTGTGGCAASGFQSLWGIEHGVWMKMAGTQNDAFGCDDLAKYKIPSAIAGTTCISSGTSEKGGEIKAYNQL